MKRVVGDPTSGAGGIAARFPSLSYREAEISSLVARRLSTSEISVCLSIKARTVEKHLENIFDKLDVQSREQLRFRLGVFPPLDGWRTGDREQAPRRLTAMSPVYVFSVKLGTSHGGWQYKHRGTHDKVMMNGLRPVLDAACRLLGFDCRDRSIVYLLYFSAEPFEAWQVCLERMREASDESMGCYYRVRQSTIGDFTAKGLFPAIVKTAYLRAWPERIYVRLEKSLTGGIVS